MDKKLIRQLESSFHLMTPEEKTKTLNFLRNYKIQEARKDFYLFLRLIAPEMIPGGDFRDGRHLGLYCNELEKLYEAVAKGDKYKLQFHLPPGGMKSLASCIFVAWVYGKSSDWYVLHIGHTQKFAEETFGAKIKEIIELDVYQEIFPDTKISNKTRAKGNWKTTKGGVYHANGAGNAIAGKRAHVLICDDVLSEQTAMSKTERNKINEWYIPGARSRLLPASGELIINTRWNMEDLSGYITKLDNAAKQAPWKIIAIPAILEGPLGERAAELLNLPVGSSYWPEFWPLDTFENTKKTATPYVWNSLYMQNPTPADGIIFNKKSFNLWDTFDKGTPRSEISILSMDTAFSKEKRSDFSAWGVWNVFLNEQNDKTTVQQVFLAEAGKARLSYPELVEKVKELYERHDIKYILVEKKGSGQSLIQDLSIQGFPIIPFDPGRDDKETRANSITPFLEAGLVWVPEHEVWSKEFVQECLEFPSGAHDDQVDQFTQAMLWLRDNMLLNHNGRATMEDDEDPSVYNPPRRTYWRLVNGRRS